MENWESENKLPLGLRLSGHVKNTFCDFSNLSNFVSADMTEYRINCRLRMVRMSA